MPKLTIDDHQVEVPEGATILDAARQLGIEIPTLCFLRGYEASTSCQVCMVRNRANGQLLPSCGTKVVEGMEIESETEEVHAVRRTALELLFSEHVGDCVAPCTFACPAHMDVPLMLRQIGDEELGDAIETVKQDIALPAILGRICPKPCEKGCRRKGADNPVAVCELKRYAADADLRSENPYMPECKPATGKRVAIIGAGPTGLAGAYYLRQYGHDCVMYDDRPKLGGRIHDESSEEEMPRDILDAECRQVLRLGVELHANHRVASADEFEDICNRHDAVFVACGKVPMDEIRDWGMKVTRRGIATEGSTYATSRTGVFAGGCVVRGKAMVVRSVADGKEAAESIDRFLRENSIRGIGKPFSSRIGRLKEGELDVFLTLGGKSKLHEPARNTPYAAERATEQSERCFACDCVASGNCRLERYAEMYQADTNRFAGERRPFEVIGRVGSVSFEPGKCIKCELCVQIASKAKEPLGLTFVGRGFNVQLSVPFDGTMDQSMTKVAEECIAACPTGAIYFSDRSAVEKHPCAGQCAPELVMIES